MRQDFVAISLAPFGVDGIVAQLLVEETPCSGTGFTVDDSNDRFGDIADSANFFGVALANDEALFPVGVGDHDAIEIVEIFFESGEPVWGILIRLMDSGHMHFTALECSHGNAAAHQAGK